MKSAVWYGEKDIRVEEREPRKVNKDEVKVKVAWAGICGSDLHEYEEGPVFIPSEESDPISKDQAPFSMGHEFAGVVEEVGANVSSIKKGDRVAINPVLTYGDKPPHEDIFDGVAFIGLSTEGGFADYAIANQKNIYHLPDSLTLEHGALVEPTAVAVQAVKETELTLGQSVAVFGAGPIGLLTIQAARAAGATNIIALDLSPVRLEKAKEIGATHTINSKDTDPVEAVKEIEPDGVDVSFEVAGVGPTFNQSIQATKARGVANIVSIFANEISFNPMLLTLNGTRLVSTLAYEPDTFQETIELMASGQLQPESVITDRIQLDDIVEKGFEALSNDKSQAKILVELSGEK